MNKDQRKEEKKKIDYKTKTKLVKKKNKKKRG